MQFRPMMTAAEKSPAFLRASLVLATTSSFFPVVFSRCLSIRLFGYYEPIKSTNQIYQQVLLIIVMKKKDSFRFNENF
jgi:hypothetical protein